MGCKQLCHCPVHFFLLSAWLCFLLIYFYGMHWNMNQHICSHKANLKRKTWLCASREFTLNVCEHSRPPGCDTCCPLPKITCIFWPSVSAPLALLSFWYSLLWGIRNSYELCRMNLYLYTQLWLKTRLL